MNVKYIYVCVCFFKYRKKGISLMNDNLQIIYYKFFLVKLYKHTHTCKLILIILREIYDKVKNTILLANNNFIVYIAILIYTVVKNISEYTLS